jgi:hypothetical protein
MADLPIIEQRETGLTAGEKGAAAAIFLALMLMLAAALYLIQPPSDRSAQDVASILTPDGE